MVTWKSTVIAGFVAGLIALGAGLCLSAERLNIPNAAYGSISPDGKRIAFQYKTPAGWRIAVSAMDGSGLKVISTGKGNDVEPCWRGDGKSIVFSSNRSGHYNIYVIAPDGTHLKRLTKSSKDDRTPQWSPRPYGLFPQGEITKRTIPGPTSKLIPTDDLKVLEELAKGSGKWESYKIDKGMEPAGIYYKLIYTRGTEVKARICTMRSDGSFIQVIPTGLKGVHRFPCWSPNAGEIAFVLQNGSRGKVYTADYPTTTDTAGDDEHPKWAAQLSKFKKSMRYIAKANRKIKGLAWTQNGEYVAILQNNTMSLLPISRSFPKKRETTVLRFNASSWGGSWLPDCKTAVVTISKKYGFGLEKAIFTNPLLDVINLRDFDGDNAENAPAVENRDFPLLAKNGFVAGGSTKKQMYFVYEKTDYSNLPIFITSDSVLHLNHLLFDYNFRTTESTHVMPEVSTVVYSYLVNSLVQYKVLSDGDLKQAALKNVAFFATAAELLQGSVETGKVETNEPSEKSDDPLANDEAQLKQKQAAEEKSRLESYVGKLTPLLRELPAEARTMVDAELQLIRDHSGYVTSPIFGGELSMPTAIDSPPAEITKIDYSQFIPRGHYTRSETLRRYFLTTRWLSAPPFLREEKETRQALLILAMSDDAVLDSMARIERVTSTFVGKGDDQSLLDYNEIAKEIFGRKPTTKDITNSQKVTAFISRIKQLPGPKVAVIIPPSMRMFPQPYTCDADIMQQLVYDEQPPDVGTRTVPRYFALGLDVMAVLGSDRAKQILDDTNFNGQIWNWNIKETQYEGYSDQFKALRNRFSGMKENDWDANLYSRVLYSVLPLLSPVTEGPAFMKTQAWQDKSLNTALATWTELKHDTMPKQPVATELGGEGGLTEAPIFEQPVGYVEPNREVYKRVLSCVSAEESALSATGFFSPEMKQRLSTFSSLLTMLIRLEYMQKSGEHFTKKEVEQIRIFGGFMEHLALAAMDDESTNNDDINDMSIVADVSSAYINELGKSFVLEEGVGRALPILVAVPDGAHRRLAAGAIFTYYEFMHDANDRLTDKAWRDLLGKGNAPKLPSWTSSFVSGVSAPMPDESDD